MTATTASGSAPAQGALPLRDPAVAHAIQGNVLSAFATEHALFIGVRLPEDRPAIARAWLAELVPLVASTEQVSTAKASPPAARKSAPPWLGLGLTIWGLRALAPDVDLDADLADHWAFCRGPVERAADLGDVDDCAPARWEFGQRPELLGALVTVAAADPSALAAGRQRVVDAVGHHAGTRIEFEQPAARLSGAMKDREHFGFRDGISQPAVKGYHAAPGNPARGAQMVEAGEFVLGWPTERGVLPCSDWLRNASFQVLRRLDQDVEGWRASAQAAAKANGVAPGEWEARRIGRQPDGQPLAASRGLNAFSFAQDQAGQVTPTNAHIRKVNPRDLPQLAVRHRLLRRGLPFGPPYTEGEKPPVERGMMFNAYMASIDRQFEYVQRLWASRPDFPPGNPMGRDPVIGGPDPNGPGYPDDTAIERFVRTRGAVYALVPSRRTLAWLADVPWDEIT